MAEDTFSSSDRALKEVTTSSNANGGKKKGGALPDVILPAHNPAPLDTLQAPFGQQYCASSPRNHAFTQGTDLLGPKIHDDRALPHRSTNNTHNITPALASSQLPYHNAENMNSLPSPLDMGAMSLPQMLGQPPLTPVSPVSSFERQHMVNEMHAAQSGMVINANELREQRESIAELSRFNHALFKYVRSIEERLELAEAENADLRQMVSGSDHEFSTREPTEHLSRSASPESQSVTDLYLDIPSDQEYSSAEAKSDSSDGATPVRFEAEAVKKAPKSSHKKLTAPVDKKPTPLLQKRPIHNVSSMCPPAMALIPSVPLTDKELIVYFFNALCRPAVVIRLQVRQWGPAKIAELLNEHREINPPYLRNTCSVKCTTAIRRGESKFGKPWVKEMRKRFEHIDDARATELLRIPAEESTDSVDVDVKTLLRGLNKHPDLDANGNPTDKTGIFTKCLMWCEQNDKSWLLSEIHQLAAALRDGTPPESIDHGITMSLDKQADKQAALENEQDTDEEEVVKEEQAADDEQALEEDQTLDEDNVIVSSIEPEITFNGMSGLLEE